MCSGLADRGVQIMLIGGYALPVYGVVRQTVDVDCLVVDRDERIINEILTVAGYVERQRTEAFVRYAHPSDLLMDADVMIVDSSTFGKVVDKSALHQVGSVMVRVPCLAHLIALKLHAIKNNPKREIKDLADIVELLRENPESIGPDELQEICSRYGPEGINKKLESYL